MALKLRDFMILFTATSWMQRFLRETLLGSK
jgi:hypothetical protein